MMVESLPTNRRSLHTKSKRMAINSQLSRLLAQSAHAGPYLFDVDEIGKRSSPNEIDTVDLLRYISQLMDSNEKIYFK
ncbi:hypothetical protein SNEBB_006098 [Seison nebaliae]|nr:hypothetical protein SNEBB_006098 [Seison nebaliae]